MSGLVFPPLPGLGIQVTREPIHNTLIQTSASRREQRATFEASPIYHYRLTFNFLRTAAAWQELQSLYTFLVRHAGQLDSFLFTDPEDNAVTAHGFGVGDGVTTSFQLQRSLLGNVWDKYGGPWPQISTPRTNLVTYSQAFDNAAWVKSQATVTAASAIAPDGTLTAAFLQEDNTSNVHVAGSTAFPITTGATYTFSCYAQAAPSLSSIAIRTLGSPNVFGTFDLVAGVVTGTTNCTAAMQALPNGWYRCWITFVETAATIDSIRIYLTGFLSYLGAFYGCYIWGAQAELGSTPTQYVPTTAASVQQSAYWPAYSGGFEPVYEPAPGPVLKNGATILSAKTDYSIGATGLVTFTVAPAAGAVLTWTGSYYRRARFAADNLAADRIVAQVWNVKSLDLVSVKP